MVVDDHAARVAAQAVLLHVVQNLILVDDNVSSGSSSNSSSMSCSFAS